MGKRYGATSEDWALFSDTLGLREDLLPVVSKPDAEISPKSSLKTIGKTPSCYYSGLVGGIKDWTNYKATPKDIEKWEKEEDYGTCIQTRKARAIDVDVEDTLLAREIFQFINCYHKDIVLPFRFRSDSGKHLFALRLPGTIGKRSFKTKTGIVEFLGTGQQFIAAGTHQSGARYEWDWQSLDDFPELTLEQFENLWAALVKEFAISPSSTGSVRRKEADIVIHDPVVGVLQSAGKVLSVGKGGQLNVDCPNKAQHSMDNGDSQTSYFLAGSSGYEQGKFICLHAHCADLSQEYFLDAFGVRAAEFDIVEETRDSGEIAELPKFKRDKIGILSSKGNLQAVLMRPDVCKFDLSFDSFKDEIMITPIGKNEWRNFRDIDYFNLCVYLESEGFKDIKMDTMRAAVHSVAHSRAFDSAITWLNTLPKWDNVSRVAGFLHHYLGAENNDYTKAVSTYIWTALAGRVLVPGIKADMVPILEGAQGILKSTIVKAMAPAEEFFTEMTLGEKDDDLSRKMRGRFVIELSEIRMNHREMEWLKAFASRTHENWVPKFKEFSSTYPRRMLLIGTTNDKEFLYDTTGNRRWLPVHVSRGNLKALERDRLQLWAEGRAMFEKSGIFWQAEKLAAGVHEEYKADDPREAIIHEWIYSKDELTGGRPIDAGFIMIEDVIRYAMRFDARSLKGNESKTVGKILRSLGFERVVRRIKGENTRVWVEPGSENSDLY